MMDTSDNISKIKERVVSSLEKWINATVDDFSAKTPRLQFVSPYLKKGAKNLIARNCDKLADMIDNISLFISDENGNIDLNTLAGDLMTHLKSLPETPFRNGIMSGSVGQGKIRIDVPDGIISGFLLGNIGSVTIGEKDFEKLRDILVEELS